MFEFTINEAELLNGFLRDFSAYVNKSYKFTAVLKARYMPCGCSA